MDLPNEVVTLVRAGHIAAGSIALFVAPGAMLTVKGGRWHRRWGRIYVWAMGVVAVTAIALAVIRPNLFLALVAVFSFYLAFIGQRTIARRRLPAGRRVTPLDWAGTVVAAAGAVGLLLYAFLPREGGRPGLWPVALVFGLVALLLAGSELRTFRRPAADPRAWRYRHMGNMLGAYIATVSAFSVVNFTALPPIVRWLWPTAVGVPLILLWIRHYRLQVAAPGLTR
jgi:uncharacterized membrane protein